MRKELCGACLLGAAIAEATCGATLVAHGARRCWQERKHPTPRFFLQGCESKTHNPSAVRKHVKINVMLK